MSKQTKLPIKRKGSGKRKKPFIQSNTKQLDVDDYTFQNNIIKFTNQLSSTITLNNITKEKFFDDIIDLKNNKNKIEKRIEFIQNYSNLFDGQTAKFGKKAFLNKNLSLNKKTEKAIESFLGSIRRNSNIKQIETLTDIKFINFNKDLRFAVQSKAKIIKKVKKAKTTTYSRSTIYSKKEKMYKSSIGYIGFAEKEVSKLKQAWQIDFIIKNGLIGRQEVLIRIKYDLYIHSLKKTGKTKRELFDKDLWLTFSSGFTKEKQLIILYFETIKLIKDFIERCQQSKLEVNIKRMCTYVIGKGNR